MCPEFDKDVSWVEELIYGTKCVDNNSSQNPI